VELAAIELVGRLARVPYWNCLGANDSSPAVSDEIRDWYDAMAAQPAELIEYFQRQMRARRVYNGPVDGLVNDDFKEAISRYREALGHSREAKLTIEFFRDYLRSDHRAMAGKVAMVTSQPAPSPAAASTAAPAAATTALSLQVAAAGGSGPYPAGALVQLAIRPNRDAQVYCWLRDENAQIQRIFPNRFARDALVDAMSTLELPGPQRFQIVANSKGVRETVACWAAERDVLADLPPAVTGTDFAPLPVESLDQIGSAFAAATRNRFAEGRFHVDTK
jgi:hypothetical protein